jgi:hypothetical protein
VAQGESLSHHKKRGVLNMNYKTELDRMLDEVIRSFGHESKEAIKMATVVDKLYDNCDEIGFKSATAVYVCLMKKS